MRALSAYASITGPVGALGDPIATAAPPSFGSVANDPGSSRTTSDAWFCAIAPEPKLGTFPIVCGAPPPLSALSTAPDIGPPPATQKIDVSSTTTRPFGASFPNVCTGSESPPFFGTRTDL